MSGEAHHWWDGTWNPISGCRPISPGCEKCYAAKEAATRQTVCLIPLYLGITKWVGGRPEFNGNRKQLRPGHESWVWPLSWAGASSPLLGEGMPSLIFVNDMGDLFYHPTRTIERVVGTVAMSPHIGQVLTRRPKRMAKHFSRPRPEPTLQKYRQHLWLGFSAADQREFDQGWPHMRRLAEQGFTVFVSIAPLLSPLILPDSLLGLGNRAWVIVSGEQDGDGRQMDPAWARALRDQCVAAGVAFFLIQMTARKEIPDDLRVWQFPEVRL